MCSNAQWLTSKGLTMESPDVWLNDREQAAWRAFLGMYAKVDRALREQLQDESELSLADYGVLVALSEAPAGELRSYEIAEFVQWEASRLSHQLRRMEGRGLLVRRECPTDKRGLVVAITPSGVAAIARAAPCHVATVRRVFIDRLSDAQIDALIACGEAVLVDDHNLNQTRT